MKVRLDRLAARLQGLAFAEMVEGHIGNEGFMYGEALLGPLSKTHSLQMTQWPFGAVDYIFTDLRSQSRSTSILDDPGLPPLPDGWENPNGAMELQASDIPPLMSRNRITGEEVNSDPRLLPTALEARGVSLKTFDLG